MRSNILALAAALLVAASAACGGDRAADGAAETDATAAPFDSAAEASAAKRETPPPNPESIELQQRIERESREAGLPPPDPPTGSSAPATKDYADCMDRARQAEEGESRKIMVDGCRLLPGAPKQ